MGNSEGRKMTFTHYGPGLWLYRTWISGIEEPPDDFPAFFTTEDMEAMNLEPDYEGAERVQRQKDFIDATRDIFITMSDEERE